MKMRKAISLFVAVIMLLGLLPLHSHAWDEEIDCQFCGSFCGDSYICEGGDHCSEESGRDCYEENHCQDCGECRSSADGWCEECHMCGPCAVDNECHCNECGVCGVEEALCIDCGRCYNNCGGECSEGQDHVCYECHLAEDMVCPDCGLCYVDYEEIRCNVCERCIECDEPWCDECHMGIECAMDNGTHCIDCGVCSVESKLCENCWRCYECGGECSEGDDHNCLECHVEDGEACPDCASCFIDNYGTCCESCGVCFDCCTDWCDMCNMCYECAADEGLHCKECWECLENVSGYCEECLICSDCSSGVCEGCGMCADCVEICPDCEGYCNECAAVCADCGNCEYCSDMIECSACNDYFCYSCRFFCYGCEVCNYCANVCPSCEDYCSECSNICDECGECENCVSLCETCGEYCSNCYETCPICDVKIAERISHVEFFDLTAPKEGNTPDYTLTSGDISKYALVGGRYQSVSWFENGSEMAKTDKFVAGNSYSVSIWVYAKDGYVFAVDKSGATFKTNVTATIDSNAVKVNKAYEQSPWEVIELYIDWGICNDSVIEDVIITDVTKPVAGEYPSYFATVKGTGYKINTNKNSYYDAYWKNEKWYYIKNGVGWYDVTKDDWVYEHEKFIPSHEYKVFIYLDAEDGYEFYHDKWYDILISATVNGNMANFKNTGSECAWNQQITYTFTCEIPVITQIKIDDLIIPFAGSRPDLEITVDRPELYQPDPNYGYAYCGVIWYDEEGVALGRYEEFEAGKKYRAEVKIVSTKQDGVYMSIFDKRNMTVINDTPAGKITDSALYPTELYVMDRVLYAYFDYECRESEGETKVTLKAYPDSGKVAVGTTLCTDIWQRDPVAKIAFYDKDGILIHTETMKVAQGFVTTFKSIDIPSGAVKCKAMLWDGEVFEPLYEVQIVNVN